MVRLAAKYLPMHDHNKSKSIQITQWQISMIDLNQFKRMNGKDKESKIRQEGY